MRASCHNKSGWKTCIGYPTSSLPPKSVDIRSGRIGESVGDKKIRGKARQNTRAGRAENTNLQGAFQ